MPHKDHRSGNSATASAFKDALQTLQTQLAGTPLVTKELVAASTHRVAKRARSFSVSSAAAEEGGAPPAPKGRTRQRSIDYTVDALLKKEHKAGARDLPDIDDADVEVRACAAHLPSKQPLHAWAVETSPGRRARTLLHAYLSTG